jgi:hypothetical protein
MIVMARKVNSWLKFGKINNKIKFIKKELNYGR